MLSPKEFFVDLSGGLQVLDLLQPRERAELIAFLGHLNPLEDVMQLPYAISREMTAAKSGELRMNSIEINPVATIVTAARTGADLAPGKLSSYDLGNFADPIVLGILTDIEYLSADRVCGRN